MSIAKGSFEIQLAPRNQEEPFAENGVGRMSFDKQFQGDLEGTSIGMMLSLRTETEGSAGYVALEKVTGTLAGKSGSFVLQHSSTMDRGKPSQSIQVIPDSGTGELVGIRGELEILIENGEHFYEFEYQLPAAD